MPKQSNAVDLHVAARLRAARHMANLSQEQAGEHLGLTFQQVQKYEKGSNRVSAGRIASLCQLYGVTVAWLFEGAPDSDGLAGQTNDIGTAMMALPYGPDVARDYAAITNQARSVVAQVAHALAARQ